LICGLFAFYPVSAVQSVSANILKQNYTGTLRTGIFNHVLREKNVC